MKSNIDNLFKKYEERLYSERFLLSIRISNRLSVKVSLTNNLTFEQKERYYEFQKILENKYKN